jgi:hypothetical protein
MKLAALVTSAGLLVGCTPVWDMESTSKAVMTSVTKRLEAWGYDVNPLEKGCGIGIDCNDPNYKLVAGKPAIEDANQNQCEVAINLAVIAGLSKWSTSEDNGKKHELKSTKDEAQRACESMITKIPKFEEESGFAEADSESIDFFGEFKFPKRPVAPGQMSFWLNVQREDGQTGEGTRTFVIAASTTFME